MADYTFTTTAVEEAALTDKRLLVNVERVAAGQAEFPTNQSFVTVTVRETLMKPMVAAYIERRLQQVADAYRTATAVQRSQVDSALGL